MEQTIFADGVANVYLANNNLRIELVQVVGDGKSVKRSGTLVLPINQAQPMVNTLARALSEIGERIKEMQTSAAEGNEPVSDSII